MVLEYLPKFAQTKSPSFVGKYTSTMEYMGMSSEQPTSPQMSCLPCLVGSEIHSHSQFQRAPGGEERLQQDEG